MGFRELGFGEMGFGEKGHNPGRAIRSWRIFLSCWSSLQLTVDCRTVAPRGLYWRTSAAYFVPLRQRFSALCTVRMVNSSKMLIGAWRAFFWFLLQCAMWLCEAAICYFHMKFWVFAPPKHWTGSSKIKLWNSIKVTRVYSNTMNYMDGSLPVTAWQQSAGWPAQ